MANASYQDLYVIACQVLAARADQKKMALNDATHETYNLHHVSKDKQRTSAPGTRHQAQRKDERREDNEERCRYCGYPPHTEGRRCPAKTWTALSAVNADTYKKCARRQRKHRP